MARYNRSYAGERRTAPLRVQLTPSERERLDAAAAGQGAPLSVYARELLFRRSDAAIAGIRRNPEAAALMRELNAIGNNLNQIARQLNTTGDLRDAEALSHALDLYKQAIARVIAL